jgi:hypothetical protein
VSREAVLSYRLHANHLAHRLPRTSTSQAAFAGLQDSVPRSALLSLHARVQRVEFDAWDDPDLIQVWGPRGSVYVIPRKDLAVFTLGRLPRDDDKRSAVEEDARRVRGLLEKVADGLGLEAVTGGSVGRVREAAATGTIRIRWDGSSIEVWVTDPPADDPEPCRLELARRYIRALAPSDSAQFAMWAGISRRDASATWSSLGSELVEIEVEGSSKWVSTDDLELLVNDSRIPDIVRLLPPGDTYLLARDRDLLVRDPGPRSVLWPSANVPPGGLLIAGEVCGTWRRQGHSFDLRTWRKLDAEERRRTEDEIEAMTPLGDGEPHVRWSVI